MCIGGENFDFGDSQGIGEEKKKSDMRRFCKVRQPGLGSGIYSRGLYRNNSAVWLDIERACIVEMR